MIQLKGTQLDARKQSAGSAAESDICSTHCDHAGICWNFFCIEQSVLVMCACALKLPTLAVQYQAYYASVNKDG